MPRVDALPRRLLILAVVVLLHLVWGSEGARAQGQPAVVEGTSKLFIRRGAGREFPPFATLTGGSQVQVHEQRGTWARVSTASGQVGYVHTKFLRLLDQGGAPSTPEVGNTESPAAPTATAAPANTVASPRPTSTRRLQAGAELSPPAMSPATIETPTEVSSPTPTGTTKLAPPRPAVRDMQSEVERLSNAVEALNSRLDQRFPLPEEITTAVADSGSGVSGGAILLGVLGLIAGWILGATYQRNKDRGRRSRIRL